jgi:NAD(P)H-nitrite reductase large subunit
MTDASASLGAAANADVTVTGANSSGGGFAGLSQSQLYQKVQEVYKYACISSQGHTCQGCGAPNMQTLLASVQQLLVKQQQEHERQLQHQRLMHQQEVEQIKATAIKRMKEVMQKQKE